jgi:tRNA (cytidine/uridine-2'-O-)-methyltransferase
MADTPPLHIVLWEPEIPPNTGNVARLCAATGCMLHLVGRLGFRLDDKSLKRAGLDYWHAVTVARHDSIEQFEAHWLAEGRDLERIFTFSARGSRVYTEQAFALGDGLLFGSESRGLADDIRQRYQARELVIPMPAGKVRSLNLSTAVGIVAYEALRQLHIR